jgi:hypothetical protein
MQKIILLFSLQLLVTSVVGQIDSTAWLMHKAVMDSTLKKLNTDLKKTTFIRKYIARFVTNGETINDKCNNYYKTDSSFNLAEFFHLFSVDSGAAKCGLTSYILAKVYEHYGYKAYTYNMGFPSSICTHETNLVYITHKNSTLLICQDGMFNYTLTDKRNQPIDFFRLIKLVKTDIGAISVQSDTVMGKVIRKLTGVEGSYLNNPQTRATFEKAFIFSDATTTNNIMSIPCIKNYNVLMNFPLTLEFKENCFEQLKIRSEDENFLNLYLHPIGEMRGSFDKKKLLNKIKISIAQKD